ncbi:type VI secretion system baseplate subunit TssG [Nannocystaceae bacterium ST9]
MSAATSSATEKPSRRSGEQPSWLTRLLAEPAAYDPFMAVGLLERHEPRAPRIGGDGPYDHEAIRFRHSRSLAFKPGDVHDIQRKPSKRRDGPDERFELTLNVVGLIGTSSPLPTYLASEAAAHDEAGDAKADFFDLFHHRLHSLLYRSLRKLDWPREHEREGGDAWSRRLLALLGIDTYDRPPLQHIRSLDLLRIAPLMVTSARTARTLELAIVEILGHLLGEASVEVQQFRGGFADIDKDHKMRLAVENSQLGVTAVIGDMCMHRAGLARIVVGPLDEPGLRRFLVGGEAFVALRELLDVLAYELVEFELELILGRETRRGAILGISKIGDDAWLAMSDDDSLVKEETRMFVPMSEALDMMRQRGD